MIDVAEKNYMQRKKQCPFMTVSSSNNFIISPKQRISEKEKTASMYAFSIQSVPEPWPSHIKMLLF